MVAAARMEKRITEDTVVQAHTYLRYIEDLMPKALGEFGKAKNADLSHRILSIIETRFPISLKDILKEVSSDIDRPAEVGDVLRKLLMAEKIQATNGIYLPKRKVNEYEEEVKSGFVDYERFLTQQELGVKK